LRGARACGGLGVGERRALKGGRERPGGRGNVARDGWPRMRATLASDIAVNVVHAARERRCATLPSAIAVNVAHSRRP
jgi:hypothetical protein